jgi:dTDP-glucose 4,6-dehydratase
MPTPFSTMPTARPPWTRAAVTGGAGFLGSHLCERLPDSGVAVDCVDDLSTGSVADIARPTGRPGFRFLAYDISRSDWPDTLAGPYDLVLHCPHETGLTRHAGGDTAVDLGGRTDARRLAGVLRNADAVVTGSTRPAVPATAIGTPVVPLHSPVPGDPCPAEATAHDVVRAVRELLDEGAGQPGRALTEVPGAH